MVMKVLIVMEVMIMMMMMMVVVVVAQVCVKPVQLNVYLTREGYCKTAAQ